MDLTKKDKTVKYIVYCAILMICALLQNTAGLFPEIGGARCFILIPACVLMSLDEDEKAAALLGLFAGLLWDIVSAEHMGYNCVFLMLVCFISSTFVTYVFRNTFAVSMVCTAVSIVLYCLFYWLIFMVIQKSDGSVWTLFYFYIPCAVYSMVTAPLFYLILKPLGRKLNKNNDFID